MNLPSSYKDFLLAYKPRKLEAISVPWGEVVVGFFAPSQVDRVVVKNPALLEGPSRFPIDSPDEEYFVYGVKQSSTSGRTKHLSDALIVGSMATLRSRSLFFIRK